MTACEKARRELWISNHTNTVMIKILFSIQILVLLLLATAWGVNFYKFARCDFKPPYKSEIIHGIGTLGPLFLVTVWFK